MLQLNPELTVLRQIEWTIDWPFWIRLKAQNDFLQYVWKDDRTVQSAWGGELTRADTKRDPKSLWKNAHEGWSKAL